MRLTSWKHSGKCAVCGKPTALLIHQSCGNKLPHPKRRQAKPYSLQTIRHISGR